MMYRRTLGISIPPAEPSHLVPDERVELNEAIAKGSIPKKTPDLGGWRGGQGGDLGS